MASVPEGSGDDGPLSSPEFIIPDQVPKQSDGNRAALYAALFRTGHPRILKALRYNSNTPPDIKTEILARQSSLTYLCHLARTQPLTVESAVAYAEDFRMIVRHAVAQNGGLPLAAQKILVRDKSPRVLSVIAKARYLAPEIYEALVEPKVLGGNTTAINLARNPAIPASVTEMLSRHQDSNVRAHVAARHDLTPVIIKALHADEDQDVVNTIETNRLNQYRGYHYVRTLQSGTFITMYKHPYEKLFDHYDEDDDPPELDNAHWFTSPFFLDE